MVSRDCVIDSIRHHKYVIKPVKTFGGWTACMQVTAGERL